MERIRCQSDGKGMSQYTIFWQDCKDNNAGVGFLISGRGIDKVVNRCQRK